MGTFAPRARSCPARQIMTLSRCVLHQARCECHVFTQSCHPFRPSLALQSAYLSFLFQAPPGQTIVTRLPALLQGLAAALHPCPCRTRPGPCLARCCPMSHLPESQQPHPLVPRLAPVAGSTAQILQTGNVASAPTPTNDSAAIVLQRVQVVHAGLDTTERTLLLQSKPPEAHPG